MQPIATYQNGNCTVTMFADGTKIREYDGIPAPVLPESIDVKITNYCDAGCGYCHERSTKSGLHGDLALGARLLTQLPAGTEVAIGGGNPLDHPLLVQFLQVLKDHGIIANITVNQVHLERYRDRIAQLRREGLIHGFGLSYHSMAPLLHEFVDSNTVFHLIMGVHTIDDLRAIQSEFPRAKVLILGYKQVGRGIAYYSDAVKACMRAWVTHLHTFFNSSITLSFDNLAIKQLDMRRFFSDSAWDAFYMGDDGTFTMYMDLVKREYAVSSTSANKTTLTEDIRAMFAHVRSISL